MRMERGERERKHDTVVEHCQGETCNKRMGRRHTCAGPPLRRPLLYACFSGMGVGSPGHESLHGGAKLTYTSLPTPYCFQVQCRVDDETSSGLQFHPPSSGLQTSSVFLPPTHDSRSIPCMHLWSVGFPCFCLSLSLFLFLSICLSLPPSPSLSLSGGDHMFRPQGLVATWVTRTIEVCHCL